VDCQKLDELVAIEKKSDASNAKKEEYCMLITELLNEEGYSVCAEKYVFNGFSFIGMKPVIDWALSKAENDCYSFIRNGRAFNNNENGISFKVALSVFTCLINHKTMNKIDIENIIKDIPHLSKNKEGKKFGSCAKSIEKYFIIPLSDDAVLPELSAYELHPNLIKSFTALIKESLEVISPKSSKESKRAKKVQQWVSEKSIEPILIDKPTQSTGQVQEKKKIINAQVLIEAAHYFETIEKDYFKLLRDSEKQNIFIQSVQNEYSVLKEELSQVKSVIQVTNERAERLLIEKTKLIAENKDKEDALHDRDEKIMKQKSILNIYESNKKSSQQEHLNMIASKLKGEYCDFKDALEMEMDVELGENMRQQMKEIFKILSKNGIDIENR